MIVERGKQRVPFPDAPGEPSSQCGVCDVRLGCALGSLSNSASPVACPSVIDMQVFLTPDTCRMLMFF